MNKLYLIILIAFINKIYCWDQYQFPLLSHLRDNNRYGYDPEHNALTKLKGNRNLLNQQNNYRFVSYPISTQNLIKYNNNWPQISSHLNIPLKHDETFVGKQYPQNGQQLPSVNRITNSFSYNTNEIGRQVSSGGSGGSSYGNNAIRHYSYINSLRPHNLYYIANGQHNINSKIINDKLQLPQLSNIFPNKKENALTPTTTSKTITKINPLNYLKRKPVISSHGIIEQNINCSSTIQIPSEENENKKIEEQINNLKNAEYNFKYDTVDGTQRQESSDAHGYIKGSYSYKNEAGIHDLKYIAGPNIGFIVTGGSLAIPNGLNGDAAAVPAIESSQQRSNVKSSNNENNNDANNNNNNNNNNDSYTFLIDKRIDTSDDNENFKDNEDITIGIPYGKYE